MRGLDREWKRLFFALGDHAAMEWPHDPDGDEGSEGGRVYGMAILAKKVDDDAFPLEFETFAAAIGHHPIRIDYERVVPAAEILDHVEAAGAKDMIDFHRKIGAAMRNGGYWAYDADLEVAG